MDTTLNISLGGEAFVIEEIAYIKLNQYLDKVKKHLRAGEFDTEEIIKDIEQRMAELLPSRLCQRKVIDSSDVQFLIDTLGKPEQYTQEEEAFSSNSSEVKRKLFRDLRRKRLGGVLSGLAYFWQIDSLWLRLIFILLLFFTNGLFPFTAGVWILLYGILWVLVPAAQSTSDYLQMQGKAVNIESIAEYEDLPPTPNVFYRSSTDKKIAGILGGLSPLLGVDSLWLRIGFCVIVLGLIPFLETFSGVLLLAYLFVWFFTSFSGEDIKNEKISEHTLFRILLFCLGIVMLLCFFGGVFMIAILIFSHFPQLETLLGKDFSLLVDTYNITTPLWLWSSVIGGTVFTLLALVLILNVLRR